MRILQANGAESEILHQQIWLSRSWFDDSCVWEAGRLFKGERLQRGFVELVFQLQLRRSR